MNENIRKAHLWLTENAPEIDWVIRNENNDTWLEMTCGDELGIVISSIEVDFRAELYDAENILEPDTIGTKDNDNTSVAINDDIILSMMVNDTNMDIDEDQAAAVIDAMWEEYSRQIEMLIN
jgi:hypothetical protein